MQIIVDSTTFVHTMIIKLLIIKKNTNSYNNDNSHRWQHSTHRCLYTLPLEFPLSDISTFPYNYYPQKNTLKPNSSTKGPVSHVAF